MANDSHVIRLFFARMKQEFFELSDSERRDFMAKDRRNLDELGMRAVSMVQCTGESKEWDYIGVEAWPSYEAIARREKFEAEDLDISKYVEYKTILGIEQSFEAYGR